VKEEKKEGKASTHRRMNEAGEGGTEESELENKTSLSLSLSFSSSSSARARPHARAYEKIEYT